MRQLLMGFLLAAIAGVTPTLALAGNQEVAERIADSLKTSGQLNDYKIAVKYQDGTAWLKGQVQDERQATAAMKLALANPSVERVVNDLTCVSDEASSGAVRETAPLPMATKSRSATTPYAGNNTTRAGRAEKVASSFTQSAAQPASAIDSGMASQQEMPRAMSQRTAQRPMSLAYRQTAAPADMASSTAQPSGVPGPPLPMYTPGAGGGVAPARYDQPCLPNYAWPSYASYPNYAAVTYPKQYSPTAWPYIGPFYPYPQVPLGWRKVTLEWDDGWWMLDFKDTPSCWDSPMGRWY